MSDLPASDLPASGPLATDIAAPGRADEGARILGAARRRMRVLERIADDWTVTQPLAGHRIAASLHVTAETSVLCRTLVAGGARVRLCASNPFSTQDAVAAALVRDLGVEVLARHGADEVTFARHLDGALDDRPTLVVDDGAELTRRLHAGDPARLAAVVGATEITGSGVALVEDLAGRGELCFDVHSIDGTRTKQVFDNTHGTAQSTLDALMRATNRLIAGSVVVVVGFGWVGRGIALRAAGLGARVVVTEVDPLRALQATYEGFAVLPLRVAVSGADVVVTATGVPGAVPAEVLPLVRDGAVLANAGHFAHELPVAALRSLAVASEVTRPHCVEYTLATGRRLVLVAEGHLVGPVAGEANAPEVMDTTFATQALTLAHLARTGRPRHGAGAGVRAVPLDLQQQVARLALAVRDVVIDQR